MESSSLLCNFCFERFDLEDRLPIHFPHFPPCAKTTCLSCFRRTIKQQSANGNLTCPWDKQKLKPDEKNGKIIPLPNYHFREKLEKNKDFNVCPDHPTKFQKLFCKTDKVKICSSCQHSSEGQNHKNHDVDLIVNMKPEIEDRKKLHEEGLEKLKTFEAAVNKAIDDRQNGFDEMLEHQTQVHNHARLKSRLMLRDYLHNQRKNVDTRLRENFASRQETQGMIEGFNDLKQLDIGKVLTESPEEISARYNEGKLEQDFAECDGIIEQQARDLYKRLGQLYDQKDENTSFDFQSFISFEIIGESLFLVADRILKNVKIDLAQLSGVKKVSFYFDEFDFNEEDMNLIEFVFSNFQSQLESVTLHYKDTRNNISFTQFEAHAVLFSLKIFANPKQYKSISLIFENSDGSQRYLRFLGETVLPKINSLTSLELIFRNSDLTEEVFAEFMRLSVPYLAELKSFSLKIQGELRFAIQFENYITFHLPNLERLKLNLNIRKLFKKSMDLFISSLLGSTKKLKCCEICLGVAFEESSKFMSHLFSLSDLEILFVDMPHITVDPKIISLLSKKFKGKEQRFRITSRKIGNAENPFGFGRPFQQNLDHAFIAFETAHIPHNTNNISPRFMTGQSRTYY